MNPTLEMRFVLDCETLAKVLQYRTRYVSLDPTGKDGIVEYYSNWTSVPVVLGVVSKDGVVESVINDSKK